jgi:hypothetical protein
VSSTGYRIPDTKYQKREHRSYLVDRDAVWRHCSIIIFRSFVQLIPVQVVGCGRNRGSLYSPRLHHREVSTGTQIMFLLPAIVAARYHQADAEKIQFIVNMQSRSESRKNKTSEKEVLSVYLACQAAKDC